MESLINNVKLIHAFNLTKESKCDNNRFYYQSPNDEVAYQNLFSDDVLKDLHCGKKLLKRYIHNSWGRIVPQHKSSWMSLNYVFVTHLKYQVGRIARLHPADTMILDYLDVTDGYLYVADNVIVPPGFGSNGLKIIVVPNIYTAIEALNFQPRVVASARNRIQIPLYSPLFEFFLNETVFQDLLIDFLSQSISLFPTFSIHRNRKLQNEIIRSYTAKNNMTAAKLFKQSSIEQDNVIVTNIYRTANFIKNGVTLSNKNDILNMLYPDQDYQDFMKSYSEYPVNDISYLYNKWCRLLIESGYTTIFPDACGNVYPLFRDSVVEWHDNFLPFYEYIDQEFLETNVFLCESYHSACFSAVRSNTRIPALNLHDLQQLYSYDECSKTNMTDLLTFFEGQSGINLFQWSFLESIINPDKISKNISFVIYCYYRTVLTLPDMILNPEIKNNLKLFLHWLVRILSIRLFIRELKSEMDKFAAKMTSEHQQSQNFNIKYEFVKDVHDSVFDTDSTKICHLLPRLLDYDIINKIANWFITNVTDYINNNKTNLFYDNVFNEVSFNDLRMVSKTFYEHMHPVRGGKSRKYRFRLIG